MITRAIEESIRKMSRQYPVILVQGPRQSGKTTLCKALFPDKPYILLEDPDTRLAATEDPRSFLSKYPEGAVLDEVQRVPHLLSYIQGIVDEKNNPGMFILTGSSSILLMDNVTQSLSGRVAVFTLLPLSVDEASGLYPSDTMESFIVNGGYPRLLTQKMDAGYYYDNYVSTYVEKDVRSILKIKDSDLFRKFIRLCAGRIGSILEITNLARDCGINQKTCSQWLSILESSYICFKLNPFFLNRNKRLIKSPKIYFFDTGLACALLGITSENQLENDQMVGNLFENLVILERFKKSFNTINLEKQYYYRTSDGIEVDLIEEKQGRLFPTEIKYGKTFNNQWVKGIKVFRSEYPQSEEGTIIYTGSQCFSFNGINVSNEILK